MNRYVPKVATYRGDGAFVTEPICLSKYGSTGQEHEGVNKVSTTRSVPGTSECETNDLDSLHNSDNHELAMLLKNNAESNDFSVVRRDKSFASPGRADRDSDSSTDSEEEELRRQRQLDNGESSSSSEEESTGCSGGESEVTQIWVPGLQHQKGFNSQSSANSTPVPHSLHNVSVSTQNVQNYDTIISQDGGRLETRLMVESDSFFDHPHGSGHSGTANGDSGISNECPETPSSVDPTLVYRHGSPYFNYDNRQSLPSKNTHLMMLRNSSEVPRQIRNGNIKSIMAMQLEYKASLFNILSGLYAIFVVVLGTVLPIAEVFAEPVSLNFFEGFYLYLYGVSILFLIYVYTYLLTNQKERKRRKQTIMSTSGTPLRKVSMSSSSHHTGSFYLRLGAVAFGIGSMILDGLRFGQFVERDPMSPCNNLLLGIRPIVHLVFTFVQLYFIFLNSKMCIHKYKVLARFGVMHMLATNLCVWVRNVVKETLHRIQQLEGHNSTEILYSIDRQALSSPQYNHSVVSTVTPQYDGGIINSTNISKADLYCENANILSGVLNSAGPYLYACAVTYSLIAAGILYSIWTNIGHPFNNRAMSYDNDSDRSTRPRTIVDCNGASKGLFLGILVLVSVVITTIIFFVMVDKPAYSKMAVMTVHISEMALYVLAGLAVLFGFNQMKELYFNSQIDNGLDEVLILVALTGIFIQDVFSIIAGQFHAEEYGGTLIIVTGVLELLQATLQSVYILNGLRRMSYKADHEQTKPGREVVTFLLVCNIAMWGVNTFQMKQTSSNPVQMNFYGYLLWAVATHISFPLSIFFRFHSTVCLANIWKNAYKVKVH